MRVLWLSHLVPYPPVGGVQQRSYHLIREASMHHQVHLVALNQRAMLDNRDVPTAVRHMEGMCARVEVFEIPSDRSAWRWRRLVATSFLRRAPYSVNWLRSKPMAERVDTLKLGAPAFDLIHADTLGVAPYALGSVQLPVVLNHHNVESRMMARRAELEPQPVKRLYFTREASKLRRFERRVCPEAAVNLVVSSPEARRLQEVVGSVPTAVVENGVDVDYFCPDVAPGAGEEGLIFVGGMKWYPNRDAVGFLVREVWPLLAAQPDCPRMVIVGSNPPPELSRLAGSDPRVSAPGFVDDVRPLVDQALAYVCPIRDGGGTRLKVLDALAMAKPLVATAFAVHGLGLEPGKHYLRAETPEEYVQEINKLRGNPELRAWLAAEGRNHVVEYFSWSVVGRHLMTAYDRVVPANPDRSLPGAR